MGEWVEVKCICCDGSGEHRSECGAVAHCLRCDGTGTVEEKHD